MHSSLADLIRRAATTPEEFAIGVDEFVVGVIRSVDAEMRRQPASMVYEMLRVRVARRLPGIDVDQELLCTAAAKITVGFPV